MVLPFLTFLHTASRILTTPPLLSPQSVCITPSLKLPGGHHGHHRPHSRSSQCAARLWQSTLPLLSRPHACQRTLARRKYDLCPSCFLSDVAA
ncbi:hypothetical protein C8J57DRAFT_1737142 [Mycena rebaudengoi]|nr:hypothetical protein C8J57DRAFT_1737142 [Mycena rebaudengoi]